MAAIALPESKSALRTLARRGINAANRRAAERRERKERRWEYGGAIVVLPLLRDLVPMLPVLGGLQLDPRLKTALTAGVLSAFTNGMISDAAHGATLGAIGAYTYNTKGLLGGLLGGNNNGG